MATGVNRSARAPDSSSGSAENAGNYAQKRADRRRETGRSCRHDVRVLNRTDKPIRASLYNVRDPWKWMPLGGSSGSGTAIIEPSETASLSIPDDYPTHRVVVRIFRPLLVNCPLDEATVDAGQYIRYNGESHLRKTKQESATIGAASTGLLLGTLLFGHIAIGIAIACAGIYASTRDDTVGELTSSVGMQVAKTVTYAAESCASNAEGERTFIGNAAIECVTCGTLSTRSSLEERRRVTFK